MLSSSPSPVLAQSPSSASSSSPVYIRGSLTETPSKTPGYSGSLSDPNTITGNGNVQANANAFNTQQQSGLGANGEILQNGASSSSFTESSEFPFVIAGAASFLVLAAVVAAVLVRHRRQKRAKATRKLKESPAIKPMTVENVLFVKREEGRPASGGMSAPQSNSFRNLDYFAMPTRILANNVRGTLNADMRMEGEAAIQNRRQVRRIKKTMDQVMVHSTDPKDSESELPHQVRPTSFVF